MLLFVTLDGGRCKKKTSLARAAVLSGSRVLLLALITYGMWYFRSDGTCYANHKLLIEKKSANVMKQEILISFLNQLYVNILGVNPATAFHCPPPKKKVFSAPCRGMDGFILRPLT